MITKIKITLLFFFLFSFYANSQCSMCRAVIESQEGQEMAEGINDGIKYLMIIPYIILFFLFRKQLVNFYKTIKSKS